MGVGFGGVAFIGDRSVAVVLSKLMS